MPVTSGGALDSTVRKRRGSETVRYSATLFAMLFLASCASNPVPELIEAAKPKPETPATVAGELLQTCRKAARLSDAIVLDAEAFYNPGYTYNMAERIHQAPGDPATAEYARRVRAYVANGSARHVLGGKIMMKLACFYELKDGQLRFLSAVTADDKGYGSREDFGRAARIAYTVMSGKDPTQVLLFGAYAK